MLKRTLLLISFLFLSTTGHAAVEALYICPSGYGAGATNGSNWANCFNGFSDVAWSAADETAGSVDPGDILYLRDDDGIYYEQINIGASGTSGNVITIKADTGEIPVISGEVFLNATWNNEGSGIYSKSVIPSEGQSTFAVFENGTTLLQGLEVTSMQNGWSLHSGSIYKATHPDLTWNIKAVHDNQGSAWHLLVEETVSCPNGITTGEWCWDSTNKIIYVNATANANISTSGHGFIILHNTSASTLSASESFYNRQSQTLYVKLSDATAPQNQEVSYTDKKANISIDERSYITINGITMYKSYEGGVWENSSIAINGLTITNNIFDRQGLSAIRLHGSASITRTNTTITGNTITNFPMRQHKLFASSETLDMSGILVGSNYESGISNTVTISNNIIDGKQSGSGGALSNDRQGILVMNPVTAVIEGNGITGVDHGIWVRGDNGPLACSSVIIRYNKVYSTQDDGIWINNCMNTEKNNVKVYANVLLGIGDDAIDITNSEAVVINNTLYGWISDGLVVNYSATYNELDFYNNVLHKTSSLSCGADQDSTNCFARLGYSVDANQKFNFNNYYTDSTGNQFVENCQQSSGVCTGLPNYGTFSEWKNFYAGNDNLSIDINPSVNPVTGIASGAAVSKGMNTCGLIPDVLHENATWSITSLPVKGGSCPESNSAFDMGAFRIGQRCCIP